MKEKLKNELILLLDKNVDSETLHKLERGIEIILSNYEVDERQTNIVLYKSVIPKTVEIYIVSKKIEGLSDKTLYLYKIVLEDFFQTVRKDPENITANDIRVYLYKKIRIRRKTHDHF